MKKEEYYLGLDIGTDSVGWAATNLNYQLCKANRKKMIGVRLFEGSKTAADRRIFRTSRRRNDRKKQRIQLLQELFAPEISKVDMGFFHRLKESNFHLEDKDNKQPNALFNDQLFTDKQYHIKYPTIYHLRKELVDNKHPHDVRLVYLAIHHIIKHRGHFLFDSLGTNNNVNFTEIFNNLVTYLREDMELDLYCNDTEQFGKILIDRYTAKSQKERLLLELCGVNKKDNKQLATVIKALTGLTVNIADLYNDEELKEAEITKFSFSDDYEKSVEPLEPILQERFFLIELLKAIYDWAILADILKNEPYISYGKILIFEEHKNDLKILKRYIKKYHTEKYDEIFNNPSLKANYPAYVGVAKKNNKKQVVKENVCSQEDICKYIKGIVAKDEPTNEGFTYIYEKLDSITFLPKQISKDNSVIPCQVHLTELDIILRNAEEYLPFLKEVDKNNLSVADKIRTIFTFRIPYYVGPLNNKSDKAWLVRTNQKIYPWNFNDVVNVDESAVKFIENLTNKCTYLPKEDVIPKNSLLYSEFMLLNEINNIKINGEPINVPIKKSIVDNLFKKYKKVSNKRLKDYLIASGQMGIDDTLTGIDEQIKSSLTSYLDFKNMINKYKDEEMIETIIKWIVIFGDDRKLLRKRIKERYGAILAPEDIEYAAKQKYSGWGRLSEEFLTEVYHVDMATGEMKSIISMLRDTNDNLMQLLSSNYDYVDKIKELNSDLRQGKSLQEMVDELYVSPGVKRPIMQALNITKEIVKIHGKAPKKIFVEVAREKEEVKKRTVSRKNKLLELYNACKDDEKQIYNYLQNEDEQNFKRDRLYLYYTQMGKCMYSGRHIEITEIFNENIYDVDHIFPQSKVKDDSLDNRVIVLKQENAIKGDTYPVSESIRKARYGLWSGLRQKGLISERKYDRLTRNIALTDAELEGFIARQLVETRQSTKAVAEILGSLFPTTEIVYVKANTVSEFRQKYEFVKCREVNDYHHAKDAYLNIVVGNVYNTKYTHNKAIFIKNLKNRVFSLNKMFDYDTDKAWIAGENGTIETVRKVMSTNSILFTRYATEQKGGFFDQNILKKGQGQIPLKGSDERYYDSTKYGKYNKAKTTYFCLVEHIHKGKKIRSIESVHLYMAKLYEEDALQYCTEYLDLKDPKILLKKIKYDTLFCVDGFYMHLSAKTGNQLKFKCAMQLCLDKENKQYIKKVAKYVAKCTAARKELDLTNFDGVTYEQNVALYDMLQDKLQHTIYNVKFNAPALLLKDNKDSFLELSALGQCKLLLEIIKMIGCNASLGDFSSICSGKNGQVGALYLNKNTSALKDIKQLKIIYQSNTGIFEQEIDLLGDDFMPKPRKKR